MANEDVKFCIYEKQGSNRTDWQNVVEVDGKTFVACDHYDNAQFKRDAADCAKYGCDFVEQIPAAKAVYDEAQAAKAAEAKATAPAK